MLGANQILQERYRIVRQLGQGGMGAVYEAIDERFGEPIALKEIIIDFTNQTHKDSVIKAFEREAKALAKAKHEAVPYVRDYFSELNRQFLVMELVEGEDLAEMLKKRGQPFPLEDILNWMHQLLDALDYLHHLQPQIIHRDIKPQNLKLNVRGRIKLLDFGIARSGDKTNTITNQTFVGATLNYSPFEQILRVIDQTFREFIILKHKDKAEAVLNQDTDARCDIYALGGTFYHLLTNQVPIDATKRTLDLWEGKPDPLPNPSKLNPDIPPSISACLLKALAIERDHRFASAIEMEKALQLAVKEEKARSKTSENTLAVPLQATVPNQATKSQEQILMQARTERLITADEINAPSKNEFIAETQPALATEPPLIPIFDTNSPDKVPPVTDSNFVHLSNPPPSGNFSKAEFTSASLLDGILTDEKKTAPDIFPTAEKPIQKNERNAAKLLWILPVALIGFLAIGGIGGAIWLGMPPSLPVSNKSVSNVSLSTPTVTPPTVTLTPSTSVSPISTPTQSKGEPQTPKVIETPKKLPPQIQATKPPKQKVQQDPNCIFTNSCK